jgi:MYXO-CTERM domain-containing protein
VIEVTLVASGSEPVPGLLCAAKSPKIEPMNVLARRKFLVSSATVTLAGVFASLAGDRHARARGPWGELVPDPDGILDLPAGFSYAILERRLDDMDDGYQVPGRPDGMACFAGPDNTLILMRNHENSLDATADGPFQNGQPVPTEAYDPAGMGGVTRVVVDATTFERISSNLVLIGTARNCAGGPSPWGWLSCEENTEINGEYRHGYVFVCPTDAATVQPPQPVPAYGRFYHEAVAIDPSNHHAYLTEDLVDSCLYRFVPDDMSEPFVGRLQAMKVVGETNYNTLLMGEGEILDIEWVDLTMPDPDDDSLREEAQALGAALIIRGEGIWFFEGQVYICATAGGPLGKGQIFRLIDGDNPTLEVIAVSTDASVLDNPDNITVAPWGEVFLVENGDVDNHIRWINAAGEICDFGRNALSSAEMTGVCFSPDGAAMFVNIQDNGITLVITGPFPGTSPGDGDGDGDAGDGDGDAGDGDGDTGGNTDTDTGDGTDTSGDAGLDNGGGNAGCSCSTNDSDHPGGAAAVTVAAALGLRAILSRNENDTIDT